MFMTSLISIFMFLGLLTKLLEDIYDSRNCKNKTVKYIYLIFVVVFTILMIKYLQINFFKQYTYIMLIYVSCWIPTYVYPISFKKNK